MFETSQHFGTSQHNNSAVGRSISGPGAHRAEVLGKALMPSFLVVAALSVAMAAPSRAGVTNEGGATTVTPGGSITTRGTRVAVVSATDTAGDARSAGIALLAAETALNYTRGFQVVPRAQVVAAMNKKGKNASFDNRGPNLQKTPIDPRVPFGEPALGDTRLPIDILDYKAIGKSTKAQRALSVFVTRGDSDAGSATVSAVAELYDTTSGGLVGRGESTFTSTIPAAAATVPNTRLGADGTPRTAPVSADGRPIVEGVAYPAAARAEAAQIRALSGAVYRAVNELNRPIQVRGTVISIPGAYVTRLSFGEQAGLRNGARVVYLSNGAAVAYGTITNVGFGEALATVAPQAAFSNVFVNMEVRNVNNPTSSRAGETEMQATEREFNRFERSFGIAVIASAIILNNYTDALLFN